MVPSNLRDINLSGHRVKSEDMRTLIQGMEDRSYPSFLRKLSVLMIPVICLAVILKARGASSLELLYFVEHSPPPEGSLVSATDTLIDSINSSLADTGSVGNLATYDGTATYGQLTASSFATASGNALGGSTAWATTGPKWNDSLTFSSPSIATGTAGKVVFQFDFGVGSLSTSAGPDSTASGDYDLSITVGTNNQLLNGGTGGGDPIADFNSIEFDFFWGQPIDFSASLSAFASANADFDESATASIQDLQLTLTGMTLQYEMEFGGYTAASNYLVAGDSGTTYANTIPEPAAPLLVLGAVGLIARRRRRR